jgi:hypothetical protein
MVLQHILKNKSYVITVIKVSKVIDCKRNIAFNIIFMKIIINKI